MLLLDKVVAQIFLLVDLPHLELLLACTMMDQESRIQGISSYTLSLSKSNTVNAISTRSTELACIKIMFLTSE